MTELSTVDMAKTKQAANNSAAMFRTHSNVTNQGMTFALGKRGSATAETTVRIMKTKMTKYAVIQTTLILVKLASIAIIDAFILTKSATARTSARMELTRVTADAVQMSSSATPILDLSA